MASFLIDINHTTKFIQSQQCQPKKEWFPRWLLDVSDGHLGDSINGVADIKIPNKELIANYHNPLNAIVQATSEDLLDNEYFNGRAILAPTIEMLAKINDHICPMLPGEQYELLSCD